MPSTVPTLNHLFLVSVINSHLFSPNHVEKSRHRQAIRPTPSKKPHIPALFADKIRIG